MYKSEVNINGNKQVYKKEKLLTIGIITKNECEKLERCLKSLMPIKESIDCEIIVTDTGSTDNTVEMAKEYADKIINFEWIGDFSAARNTAIKASKGLWFMWIDSDEWIENTEPLINFFKKKEYKKYLSVTMNLMDCVDDTVLKKQIFRLIMLTKNSLFQNRIHEFVPRYEPVKYMDMNIFHDGYVFQSFEEKMEKHNRNMELLLREYEEKKSDLRTIEYIVNQYRFYHQYQEVLEYCDRGLKELEERDLTDQDKAYQLHFYIMKAESCLRLKKYGDIIKIFKNIDKDNPKNARRFLDVNYIMSEAYEELGEETKSEEYAKEYIDNYIYRDDMDMTYADVFLDISNRKDIFKKMLCKCINFVDNESEYSYKIKAMVLENKGVLNEADLVDVFLYAANYAKKYSFFSELYNDIYNKKIKFDISEFEILVKDYIILNKETSIEIFKLLSELDINREFINISKFIVFDVENKESEAENIILDILRETDSFSSYSISELIYGVIKYKLDIELILNKLDIYSIKENFKNSLRKHENLLSYIFEYDDEILKRNVKALYMKVNLLDLCIEDQKLDKENLLKIYEMFQVILPIIIDRVYNKSLIEENEMNVDIYPPVLRFGYFIEKANKYKNNKEMNLYLKELKNAVWNYPLMEVPIKHELEIIEKEIELEAKRNAEFEQLAFNIKQKIYELITLGQKEEALSVIYQLQSIMPNDKELKELKSRLC